MTTRAPFARRVFLVAGVYGIVALLPQYFMEERLGRDFPPPLNHPEHFYGFLGVALAWQFAFLLISRDVARYRPLMPVAVLEKLSFGIAGLVLWGQGRAPSVVAGAAGVDLLLAVLFVLAYRSTREAIGREP